MYSIEIVKSFFAVRSYWEGFFAATWGALLWRLFAVWFELEENISHLLLTSFSPGYQTLEIGLFAFLGILCGLMSYCFVQVQRSIVLFNRKKSWFSSLLASCPLLYPLFTSLIISSLKFPNGLGQFTSTHLGMEEAMHELFSNFTWYEYHPIAHHQPIEHDLHSINHSMVNPLPILSDHDTMSHEAHVIHNWSSHSTSIFINTFLFVVSNFFTIALASTVPVPGGLIVPLFLVGAGFGRFFGECAAYLFPYGLGLYGSAVPITPGAYAVAASAALCGGTTGSLSVAVIAFEITGQLTHFLPVIICVLCSNLVSRYLGPTVYESAIELKNLPFLPTMIKASSLSHRVLVEDFMDTNVQYIWNGCTYETLNNIIQSPSVLAFYPFVSSPDSKFLLGIIHHLEIKTILEKHFVRCGLKGNTKSETLDDSNQVTFNGRFQIWSNFGPYKVSSLKVSIEDLGRLIYMNLIFRKKSGKKGYKKLLISADVTLILHHFKSWKELLFQM